MADKETETDPPAAKVCEVGLTAKRKSDVGGGGDGVPPDEFPPPHETRANIAKRASAIKKAFKLALKYRLQRRNSKEEFVFIKWQWN